MKAIHLLALTGVLLAGCTQARPDASLYDKVRSDRKEAYTIYNYPADHLTSNEQQVRAARQAESAKEFKSGMDESELTELWGLPRDIEKSTYPTGQFDTYIYGSRGGEIYCFIFKNKKLESWMRVCKAGNL